MTTPDTTQFFNKLIYNAVSRWSGKLDQDALLREANYRDQLGGKWRKFFNKKKAEFVKTLPESEREYAEYRPIKSYISEDDMKEILRLMVLEDSKLLEPFPLTKNAVALGEMLELNEDETLVLDLAIRLRQDIPFWHEYVLQKFRYIDFLKEHEKRYEILLGLQPERARVALKGFLFKSGILQDHDPYSMHRITDEMRDSLCMTNFSLGALEETLFPSNLSTDLTPDLYPHLEKEILRTEKIINKSLESGARGANVMFWGLPGTGKTELVLALASKNDWTVKAIGDISDQDTKEKSRAERLTSLKLGMKLFQKRPKTILLFDEMEDLFKADNDAKFSKAFINRIIETSTIPIVWTTNDLKCIGSAALRRMVYNIGFEIPPASSRRVMWSRAAAKYGVELSEDVLVSLSETFDTVPALINNAMKISSMAGLEHQEITEVIGSLDRLMNYGEKRFFKDPSKLKETPYDASCANTDTDLEVFTERLLQANPAFSLCLYGAPGTGKSEYGRYLAKKMGKKVLYKRASDLQSMWVGQCEKNIAAAFRQASDDGMVLIIDEGDSFLRDRTKARASWEVSQVNEMLSQMENHDQPFIITTNLMEGLDPASLRRFVFKMKFDFMTPSQSRQLFQNYFQLEAPGRIERLDILAPGDFAVVHKKVKILDVKCPEEIMGMLEQECQIKPNYRGSTIGF